ncbi:MAG: hypothetical protein KC910_15705 [Candidatus Eremiobacteraeota bacterium]|nr:hypothetical protein [Candidatus Eremiobacteraeota bacterium]
MKKIAAVFAVLLLLAVGLLIIGGRPGSGSGGVSLGSGDASFLSKRSIDFMEDLQFKDFEKAASYHSAEERKDVNIPRLIERLFAIKPEFLDIQRYDIRDVDIDRSGNRARVKVHAVVKILNTKEVKEPEILLYWRKDPAEGWVMELQSSLRG